MVSDRLSYTIKGLAEVTGVGRNELLRAIHTKELKAFRVGAKGGKWVIPRPEAEAWLEARTASPRGRA